MFKENESLTVRFHKALLKNRNKFVSVGDLLKLTSKHANRASAYVFSLRKEYPSLKIYNMKAFDKAAKCLIGYYMLETDADKTQREIARREKKLGRKPHITS